MQAIEAARQTRQALDAARMRLSVAERKEAELNAEKTPAKKRRAAK